MLIPSPLFLPRALQSDRGMAAIEIIPILVIMIIMTSFTLGFYGVTQTATLQSMGARNYAFETFRHRSNLTYFRSNPGASPNVRYERVGARVHAILAIGTQPNTFVAETRRIDIWGRAPIQGDDTQTHDTEIDEAAPGIRFGRERTGANPVWMQVMYGICVHADCGGGGNVARN